MIHPLRAATMPVETCAINPLLWLCRLEYQGCAEGYVRRHDQPASKTTVGKPALTKQRFRWREVSDGKSHRVERHRLPDRLGRDAEPVAIGRGPHDLDIAVPGMRHDAIRITVGLAARIRSQKVRMARGVTRDQHHTDDALRSIDVGLKHGIPEVFRKVVLT